MTSAVLSSIREDNTLFNFAGKLFHSIVQWKAKEDDPPIPPGMI